MIPLEVSLVQLAQIEKDRKSKRKRVRDEMLFPKFGPQDKGEACLIFIYPPVADWRGSLWKSIHYDNEQIVIHWALSPLDSDSYQRERSRQRPSLCVWLCACMVVCVRVCVFVPLPDCLRSRAVIVIRKTSLLAGSSCHVIALKLKRCHTWLIHTAWHLHSTSDKWLLALHLNEESFSSTCCSWSCFCLSYF